MSLMLCSYRQSLGDRSLDHAAYMILFECIEGNLGNFRMDDSLLYCVMLIDTMVVSPAATAALAMIVIIVLSLSGIRHLYQLLFCFR